MRASEFEEGWLSKLVAPTVAHDIAPTARQAVRPAYGGLTGAFRGMLYNVQQKGVQLVDLASGDRIVQISGRPIVVADLGGGRTIPFYCSTGKGEKALVPAGKWYAFFGRGPDGYFNKGVDEALIARNYDNPTFQHIAQVLNQEIGDVRAITSRMKPGEASLNQINRGLQPWSGSDIPARYDQYAAYIASQSR